MKKVVYLFFIVLFFSLNSCSNFFKGDELKSELEDAIAYANAEPFDILFNSKKGDLTPNGNVQCKETQKISAYFSADDEYYFKHWQVSLNNVVLTKELAEDYVKFGNYENPSTSIKIVKKVENLVIDAACGEKPAVLEGFPRYESTGVNRDSRLTVMFSTAMNKSSIYYSEEELRAINIISKNESLNSLINTATESEYFVPSQTGHKIIVDAKRKTCLWIPD